MTFGQKSRLASLAYKEKVNRFFAISLSWRYSIMWSPDSFMSHEQYLAFLDRYDTPAGPEGKLFISDAYPREYFIMRNLDLDPIIPLVQSLYHPTHGAPVRNQMQLFRSSILFTMCFGTTPAKESLTLWVDHLKKGTPLMYMIGCDSSDSVPSLGSHYNLMDRLWQSSSLLTRSDLLPFNKDELRRGNPQIGGDGKMMEEHQEENTIAAAEAIRNGLKPASNPEALLQSILSLTAIASSIRHGLINPNNCILSGDGTCVHSHASPRGHHDRSLPLDSPSRHFSDPDADWGYDSDLKKRYYGHTLYMLAYRNDVLRVELPICFKYTSARRHDSLNFLFTYSDFRRNISGLSPSMFCLDSAHDNMPTYTLLSDDGIIPVIDLNMKTPLNSDGLSEGFTYDSDGNIRCRNNSTMVFSQFDKIKQKNKYRCPFACGNVGECKYRELCQKKVTDYGRSIYVSLPDDIRFNPGIQRGSDEWKDVYRQRTACERLNNRVLNDYRLADLFIHTARRYAFFTLMIMIAIHMDAIYRFRGISA